ncbi:MAG: radical SAM protein with 4Fe4S-binding SPASM domain [Marinoscillum sp.]|jgi:radical SAM protein with 4Fe4S-binding SPASM domain
MYINVRDGYQLASKLTFNRIKNAWRIYRSFSKSRKNGQAQISGLPISLTVEPTTACNLRCPECPSGLRSFTRPTGRLDPALFTKVIDELSDTLFYLIFYFQGEPFLHPDLISMIRYAADKRIYTATSTNAHFLNDKAAQEIVKSGLDRLIISIDGATQETYEAYRKTGELSEVLAGTERILYWKKELKSPTPNVVWQFLVVAPNEHEIPLIKRMAKEYGVDSVAFKTAQIYDFEEGNELIPKNSKYSRYAKGADGKYHIKNKMLDECWKMWHSCVMTWDGKVVPCCFDKDAHHVLGSTANKTFSEIWNGENYTAFRDQILNARTEIEMCKNCSEGTPVWAKA